MCVCLGFVRVIEKERERERLMFCAQSTSYSLQLFQKNGYDLNAYNNVRDILYNTDVITDIVKSIVHSPVGKLV